MVIWLSTHYLGICTMQTQFEQTIRALKLHIKVSLWVMVSTIQPVKRSWEVVECL